MRKTIHAQALLFSWKIIWAAKMFGGLVFILNRVFWLAAAFGLFSFVHVVANAAVELA